VLKNYTALIERSPGSRFTGFDWRPWHARLTPAPSAAHSAVCPPPIRDSGKFPTSSYPRPTLLRKRRIDPTGRCVITAASVRDSPICSLVLRRRQMEAVD
jgi:hypothetical protein